MNARTVNYCVKQGFVNIKRNKLFSLASIGTIAACIFLISVIFAIVINVNHMEKYIEQKVGVKVFFVDGIEQEGIDSIGEQIKADTRVKKYTYTSAEEAWEEFKGEYFKDDPEAAEGFEGALANSASYTVFLKDIGDQPEFVEKFQTIEGVGKVKYSSTAKEFLTNFKRFLGYASVALIVVLLGVGIFLISNTVMIGISVRKQEIKIMKLIGATNRFVRSPFIIEGVLIGVVGSALPLIVMRIIYSRIIGMIVNKFGSFASGIPFATVGDVFGLLVPLGLGIGAGIGFIGSIISLRKHLKV